MMTIQAPGPGYCQLSFCAIAIWNANPNKIKADPRRLKMTRRTGFYLEYTASLPRLCECPAVPTSAHKDGYRPIDTSSLLANHAIANNQPRFGGNPSTPAAYVPVFKRSPRPARCHRTRACTTPGGCYANLCCHVQTAELLDTEPLTLHVRKDQDAGYSLGAVQAAILTPWKALSAFTAAGGGA